MIQQAICSDNSVVFVLSMQIEEDKFMVLDGMTRCGRMFLGLGSLLVGSKVLYFSSVLFIIFLPFGTF